MAISLKTAGTWARVVTDPSSVTIPGTPAAGDRMFLFANWKDFAITVANPSGWTPIVNSFADGAVAAGNGTGSVSVAAWYRDWQSGDGNPSLNWSAAPTEAHAVIMLWTKAGSDTWGTPVFRTGAIAAASTWTVDASATVTIADASVVMGMAAFRDDSTTMTRATDALDDTGALVTWNGNYVESPATHFNSTTGFDMSGDLGHRFVTTGAAGVTLHMDGILLAAETGTALFVTQALIVAVTGTGAGSGVTPTGSGSAAETFTGTGAATTAASTGSGAAMETFTGTGTGTGTASSGSGMGEQEESEPTGTGEGTQVASSSSGIGVQAFVGTGAGTGVASSSAGTGAETFTGSGTATGTAASGSGSVVETFTGTGAGVQVPASGSGTDLQTITGTGTGIGAAATGSGTGRVREGGLGWIKTPVRVPTPIYARGSGRQAAPSGRGRGRVIDDDILFGMLGNTA